ncbi:unnamed protein product [Mytilus coruscus]|uniref:Uncharacterized protein n=1 Tax=Mytilus coruscus TaxID=42192 RepID=A0A6J8E5I9_MYTCO|nr:unnamed protein product [Mytilus coruscus]
MRATNGSTALENLFGEQEIDNEQKAREREERRKELQKEREKQGFPTDDAEIDKLLDEEETEAKRQKRRNVLEGLQMMLEDEKAALLRQLEEQVSGIDQERHRHLALVKLKMDKKKVEREEKYDSASLELKTELSKLEQGHSKWKKKSQQIAMSIDDSSITQKEEDKHLKDVANNRKDQTKLLSNAFVYRMELEERSLKTLKPELSSEQMKEELSVILLADLQDQQDRDSTTVQNIIQKQQLSSQNDNDDLDESTQNVTEKRREVLEKDYKEEREAKIQEVYTLLCNYMLFKNVSVNVILDTKTHTEERELLMELLNIALQNKSLGKTAKDMQQEVRELLMELVNMALQNKSLGKTAKDMEQEVGELLILLVNMALQNKSLGKTAKDMQQEVRELLMELVNMALQNKSLGKTAKDMQQKVRELLMELVYMALQNKSLGETAKDMQQEVRELLTELVNMALQNKSLGETAKDMQQEVRELLMELVNMALQNKSLGKTAKDMQQKVRELLMELVYMALQNKSLGETAKDMQQEVRELLTELVNMALQNKSLGETAKDMQQEVRELLMELVNMALQNKSLGKTAKDMQQEELKTELSKLEQGHSKWKKKSQQIAMSIDDSSITQKEEDKHLKDVANNRKDQTKLLSDAFVYRIKLEESSLKTLKPELSSEQMKEALSVILLADLRDQQERDSTAVQNIIQDSSMTNINKELSSQNDNDDLDESTQNATEKRREVLEKEYKEEREAKIQEAMRAKMTGEEIDLQAELKQLEKEQQAKRKALDEKLAKQKQALKDKINKKKRKGQEKEEEKIEAYYLLMLQQSQAEKSKEAVDGEKSRQSSKMCINTS